MPTQRVAVCGAALLGAFAGAPSSHAIPVRALANKICSTSGLHFSYTRAGVTYSARVRNLTATGVSCAKAASLASVVATDVLHNRRVPANLQGLKVTMRKPCTACTPNTRVTATGSGRKSGESVRFIVAGGA